MPDVSAQIVAAEAELTLARQEVTRLQTETTRARMMVGRLERLASRFGVETEALMEARITLDATEAAQEQATLRVAEI